MTRGPVTCSPDVSIETIAKLMAQVDCGMIPIVAKLDDKPIGVVTDRDICVRAVARGLDGHTVVRSVMTSPVVTISEDATFLECLREMERHQIRRLVVVDDTGTCTGVIAQADMAEHASLAKAGELVQQVSRPDGTVTVLVRH